MPTFSQSAERHVLANISSGVQEKPDGSGYRYSHPGEAGKLHTKDVLPFLQGTCVGFLARQQKCPVLTNRKKGHIILTEEGRPMTPDGSQSNARRTLAFQQAEESQVESEDSREGAAGTSTRLHHQWDKHMATLPEIREILG